VDDARGANTVASAQSVVVSLNAAETEALLREVPLAYHTHMNEVLLTALLQAFAGWTGRRTQLVHLEGHGREVFAEDVDLSRTVGWFTSSFPLVLDLGKVIGVGAELKSVKEQLRQVPQRGLPYGLLRYLGDDPALVEELERWPAPEVNFNYFGQLDAALPADALFTPAPDSAGPPYSLRQRREYLLEIHASISASQLHVTWIYSQNLHRQATIAALAQAFIAALRTLIAHCQSPEAGGYTPSDFPDLELRPDELDALLAEFGEH
jgi:non-ribosomal peptide synthase protein (TIGR01720 family)